MDQSELAWAAGFFDGEGCIQLISCGHNFGQLAISASQCNPSPLYRLREMFGGSIRHVPERRNNMRSSYVWSARSKLARSALEKMLPFLNVKANEAMIGLASQLKKKLGPGVSDQTKLEWGMLSNVMKSLKRITFDSMPTTNLYRGDVNFYRRGNWRENGWPKGTIGIRPTI